MITVGITGGIASGKSSIIEYLVGKGYSIFDSDFYVHEILKKDLDVINQIRSAFDNNLVENKDGKLSIDRKKLGEIVFQDKDKLKKLEDIVHPVVMIGINKFKEECEINHNDIIFLDIPLLFETNFDKICDVTISISIPKDLQEERFLKRAGSKEEFKKITENQLTSKERDKKADFVIDNSKTLQNSYNQLDDIIKKIL